MNSEGAQDRLTLLSNVLERHGLKAAAVIPLEYDENCPFPYNNFTFRVDLDLSSLAASRPLPVASKACTTPFPAHGISTLVFRISNPKAEGLTQSNRVQNEVAALYLARSSMPNLIPAVYDWQAADNVSAVGWILMEWMSGIPLDQHFGSLSQVAKEDIVRQIAGLFGAIQRAPLPATVAMYGGLDISSDTKIVSGAMTTLLGGPWPAFVDLVRAKLSAELKEADGSDVLQGWHKNGVRQRIDQFLESGLARCVHDSGIDTTERVLLHGDLTLSNILFDKATN